MIYHNIIDLLKAHVEEYEDMKQPTERSSYLVALSRIYYDALDNPPEGVIGVGAITYAQDMLVKSQLDKETV